MKKCYRLFVLIFIAINHSYFLSADSAVKKVMVPTVTDSDIDSNKRVILISTNA